MPLLYVLRILNYRVIDLTWGDAGRQLCCLPATEDDHVFTTAFSHYPADSYGVVFWSHGDGWLPYNNPSTRWWGQDTGNGDNRMNIPDLNEALSVAPHFDFILFDACYMRLSIT